MMGNRWISNATLSIVSGIPTINKNIEGVG